METTMESSFSNIRNKLALIEFIELGSLGFAFWCLGAATAMSNGESFFDQIIFFLDHTGYAIRLLGYL